MIKPSEMSALQTQILLEALHAAGLPPGVFNVVNGRGDVVGAELSAHPDIAKISFTGSTAVGKSIPRAGADTLKRVTLELGGKSPTLILDDADFATAIPLAMQAGFMNSGQACIAGTRILVPEHGWTKSIALAKAAAAAVMVGDPHDAGHRRSARWSRASSTTACSATSRSASRKARALRDRRPGPARRPGARLLRQADRVRRRPQRHDDRAATRSSARCCASSPTATRTTPSPSPTTPPTACRPTSARATWRAPRVAVQSAAGRVQINGLHDEPMAPFGGFKQSGIGREFGAFGLEAYLEPKAILGTAAQYQ